MTPIYHKIKEMSIQSMRKGKYNARREVAVSENGKMAYDISKLTDITKETHSVLGSLQNVGAKIDRKSLSDSISKSGKVVNHNDANIKNSVGDGFEGKYKGLHG